jgi:mycofactocin precursor
MDDTVTTHQDDASRSTADDHADELLDDELLVEEISIDGMCGVY